ncbi:DUF397 domain-containing protein [Streptomyces sp. NRRL F-5755]|uniref:DUF397 domain-containing protein n=1 Tax=Streptomyces sp. NRRL F-5755 TaxID=1519475 RepID=UPI000A7B8C88|nr:DUF397 domain-containing protein [Streptomyces sp. NRRL F-5755]
MVGNGGTSTGQLLPSGLLDLAELEHRATSISTAQIAHLPGLMQTVGYARIIFRQSIPALSPPEIEHRVSRRIKRQEMLYGDDPTPLKAIIHEAALHMQFGGRRVAKERLCHVAELSELLHVTVLVTPYSAGIFPGAGRAVLYVFGRFRNWTRCSWTSSMDLSTCMRVTSWRSTALSCVASRTWHFKSPRIVSFFIKSSASFERGGPLSSLSWQKSSHSSEGNNCLELAVGADGAVLVRESDEPSIVVTAGSAVIGGLLRAVQGGTIDC